MGVRTSLRIIPLVCSLLLITLPAKAEWVVENIGSVLVGTFDVNNKGQILGQRSDGATVLYDKTVLAPTEI